MPDPPLCRCHDTPMYWEKGAKGRWRCRIRKRERDRRYEAKAGRDQSRKNARRLYASNMYLGMCGFTDKETKEMLDGTSE